MHDKTLMTTTYRCSSTCLGVHESPNRAKALTGCNIVAALATRVPLTKT